MFENRVNESVREFEQRLQSQGLNLDSYMQYTGMNMEAFRKGFRDQAEKQVKIRLTLEKIAALEEIVPTDEEVEAEYSKMAEQYKLEVEKVKAFIPKSELVKDIAVGKAMDLVKENAEISA
jgi:trigger factor